MLFLFERIDEKLASDALKADTLLEINNKQLDEGHAKIMSSIQEALDKCVAAQEERVSDQVRLVPVTVVTCDASCQTVDDEPCTTSAPKEVTVEEPVKRAIKPRGQPKVQPQLKSPLPAKTPFKTVKRSVILSRKLLKQTSKPTSLKVKANILSKMACKLNQTGATEASEPKKRSDMATSKSVPKKLKLVIPDDEDLDDFAPYFIGKEASTFHL